MQRAFTFKKMMRWTSNSLTCICFSKSIKSIEFSEDLTWMNISTHRIKEVILFAKKLQIFMLRRLLMKKALRCLNQNAKRSLKRNHSKNSQQFTTIQDWMAFDQQLKRRNLEVGTLREEKLIFLKLKTSIFTKHIMTMNLK